MRKRRTPNAQRPMGNRIICWQLWLRQQSCRSADHRANHPSTDWNGDRRRSAPIPQEFPAPTPGIVATISSCSSAKRAR